MPRFYVKRNENEWNIFSTIVDDFIYDKWMSFDGLVECVCNELINDKKEEMKTLLTNKPELNTMSYEDALERKKQTLYNRWLNE